MADGWICRVCVPSRGLIWTGTPDASVVHPVCQGVCHHPVDGAGFVAEGDVHGKPRTASEEGLGAIQGVHEPIPVPVLSVLVAGRRRFLAQHGQLGAFQNAHDRLLGHHVCVTHERPIGLVRDVQVAVLFRQGPKQRSCPGTCGVEREPLLENGGRRRRHGCGCRSYATFAPTQGCRKAEMIPFEPARIIPGRERQTS